MIKVVPSERMDGATRDERSRMSVKDLARLAVLRPLCELWLTWMIIAAVIAAYLFRPSVWLSVIVFLVVSSRQYALLILMHDAFHSLLHPSRRMNDWLGAVLIGAPCGSSYWVARAAHLEHHRRLGEPDDPELFLHSAGAPREKRTLAGFARHFVLLVLGGQALYTHLGGGGGGRESLVPRLLVLLPRLVPVAVAQLTLLALFHLAGSWMTYFTLWALPLLTLTVVLNGLRAFCDHANLSDDRGAHSDRLVTYVSNPVERFFVAPFHMNFHAEHHLFPYVPHYNLPRLRSKLMAEPEYRAGIQVRSGYLRFVVKFLRAQKPLVTRVGSR